MSINPETDLNLEELFQPAWAKGSDSKKLYAKYEPKERPERGDRRGGGGSRREPRGERRFPGAERGPGRPKGGFRGRRPGDRPDRRESPPPLPEVTVTLHAEDKGAESLARQIKTTGRAYPLFDIAAMILQKPDRYCAVFSSNKGPDGNVLQPLFLCALDDTLWLSEDEAVTHVLTHHLSTFYQAERTEIDPPKGTYTFVAQCGMSGVILGPPNHHSYQEKLRQLHSQRFARMPFETYKARVKIVRDEAVVKQWVEEQSWKTEYTCLNVPEASRLPDMDSVENHFREVHRPAIIRPVESHTLPGPACNKLRGDLWRAFRAASDQQRRFPMQVATSLSQQFASRGLQFFKVNKTITHVWVARPTYLDLENEPVSDNVRRIVQFINEHPKCTRRQVVEHLAPTPVPGPAAAQPAEGEPAPETPSEPPAAQAPQDSEPTPEQAGLIGDLHWLIHQGHVIEFANGLLETAKKPAPKPQKTKPKETSPRAADKTAGGNESAAGAESVEVESPEPAATPAAVPDPAPSAEVGASAPPAAVSEEAEPESSSEPEPEQQPSTPAKPEEAASEAPRKDLPSQA